MANHETNERMEAMDSNTETTSNDYSTFSREDLESALARSAERIGALEDEARRLRFEQIDGSDNRLTEFWTKAQRVAEGAGFCSEFDRIAEALGGPSRQLSWSGSTTVMVTVPVSVPIYGVATPDEVQNHTMTYDIDNYDILSALKEQVDSMGTYDIDQWHDREEVEVTDTEPYTD